jgi:methylenetetrahydrofolate reductase (NADPH)
MITSDAGKPRDLASLLSSASVEVSSRGRQLQELRDNFAAGTDVTITFLPGDNYRYTVETAAVLRRAGFNPVPHIAAREMPTREALDDFLSRARGEADIRRVLLIAGDVAIARGPFRSSRDIGASGLLEANGVTAVSVAGHPEGHPFLDPAHSFSQLGAWRDWGRTTGIDVSMVTQFCFESTPILGMLGELDARGIRLPVIVGLAGPASPATLSKFALRCGIGNSIRALRAQIGRYGRLLTDTGPDEVLRGLRSAPREATASIAGFHLFPFGGLRKSGLWLRNHLEQTHRQRLEASS